MITIITPCSRPENLSKLASTVRDYIWIVCFDLSKVRVVLPIEKADTIIGVSGGVSGNLQRNKALEQVKDFNEWVYVLDDDNLIHPGFFDKIIPLLHNPNTGIITFDQQLQNGTIRKGNDPQVGRIDQAQFIVRKGLYEDYEQIYEADGILIERLIKKYPEKWLYLPDVLCFYNRLKWNS